MVSVRRSLDAARKVLVERFGHEEFQEGQWESIEALVAGRDALVVMPTGSGKSLVYQLPALMREDLTIVVSPLVSLMADQVAGLERGAAGRAVLNNSQQAPAANREALARAVWGNDQLNGSRAIDVHMWRLRTKLEAGGGRLIETVRNRGYRLL